MSFDLAVWYESTRITDAAAGEKYARLCEGEEEAVGGFERVERFIADLSSRFADLDELPDDAVDESPWSSGFERPGAAVLMCMRWGVSDDVIEFILALAEEHGLVLYDPQGDKIHFPTSVP